MQYMLYIYPIDLPYNKWVVVTHLTLWRSVGLTLATLRRWRGYVCALFRFDSRHFFLLSWLDLAMWILGSRLSVDGSKAMIPALLLGGGGPFLRDIDVNSIMFLIHNHIFPTDPNVFWGRFRVWLRGSIAGSIGSSLDYDLRMRQKPQIKHLLFVVYCSLRKVQNDVSTWLCWLCWLILPFHRFISPFIFNHITIFGG